ncbi:bleomycin hydrolase [Cordyceps militaris CM01]|uniref:Cysteine proteinase 1, mitochondrial n=1 Tax=Cordyceps militaris (strain CM01) TaxID=983644 RepID=G3JGR0_CORMM|nr:bleomycin hydrolase [Cordyceps militaris CM01]EGX92424.1 bleomycin hydrolase [Cordyceps militaris CM01]
MTSQKLSREAVPLALADVTARGPQFLSDVTNRLRHLTLSKGDPTEALLSASAAPHVFNVVIPQQGSPVTTQGASGRCWLFAATNVLRVPIMARFRLASLELSQQYLFYYDKLEAANHVLEHIIDTAHRDVDDRLVQRLLLDPADDGGQWDMFRNLVEKYGVVPQCLYPDSWSAQNADGLRAVLGTKIRACAFELRELAAARPADAAAITARKAQMVGQIQDILTTLLGAPPRADDEFVWQFTDKDGAYGEHRSTPLAFAREFTGAGSACDLAALTSVVHDPRHPEHTRLTVDRLGNVVGGRPATYINVSMATLKRACVAMLRAGRPVFFGCDVDKFRHRGRGLLDVAALDYAAAFGPATTLLEQSKADRLRSGESLMTHAMVLTGVHVDERTGASVRWQVQNSYGEADGYKGYLVMTDAWADEFLYQAVVDAQFLGEDVLGALDKEPLVLPLWDPLGSLA